MMNLTVAERRAIATALKLNEQYVYQCLTRRRTTPTDWCPGMERASGGKLTCEQLRPDVVWTRLADSQWLWHPQGRPLLDVAASVADKQAA